MISYSLPCGDAEQKREHKRSLKESWGAPQELCVQCLREVLNYKDKGKIKSIPNVLE